MACTSKQRRSQGSSEVLASGFPPFSRSWVDGLPTQGREAYGVGIIETETAREEARERLCRARCVWRGG